MGRRGALRPARRAGRHVPRDADSGAGQGIRINSIHPGIIDTPMLHDPLIEATGAIDLLLARVPANRLAEASEVADLPAFLASKKSSYCTGSEFIVDGRLTAATHFPLG